jgi:two-component system nitrate/nitrite response regulator NarL
MSVHRPSLLIVEDHALLAESLALALRLRGFEDVEIADSEHLDAEAVLSCVERSKPEVVLLDLFLGEAGVAVPLIEPMTKQGALVLILTASDDRVMLARCLEAGAGGVFDKAQPFEDLMTWVTDAALGHSTIRPAVREELMAELAGHRRDSEMLLSSFARLSEREAVVLAAIVKGQTADEIAAAQFIAVSTVRSHIRAVLEKLGVNSQLAAVALARRAGWPDAADDDTR